ncbi:LSD1 subclass zinc finger protein [Chitinophaga skermanii]|uniref:LSD1 subclass zinc finger protein n=1 Tax=Chitinophaga skermanii TaxID=331697 RepID=A0A327QYG4_9BACT|nr:hypothetical protein [Chitinophaga skermanii]RAJ06707.1 LSD1 subclass zinc finger protein [Chitinophaga skermanii]
MPFEEKNSEIVSSLVCDSCGAKLEFQPGTQKLRCGYCGTMNEIESGHDYDTTPAHTISTDFAEFVEAEYNTAQGQKVSSYVVSCKQCGATTTMLPNVASDSCPFCTSPLVVNQSDSKQITQPHVVLPFRISDRQAALFLFKWMKSRWFVPNKMLKNADSLVDIRQLKGIYLPYWNFDSNTTTTYTGERGDYYYTTETYTTTVNGKQEIRTRQVRHTRWSRASGTVYLYFDKILVKASASIDAKVERKLEPWRFEDMKAFDERYLSGFRTEVYKTKPEEGFETAKQRMDPGIQSAIRDDIGGDEQRINDYRVTYEDPNIQYAVLPVWISSYKYNNKVYNIYINASTGEVIGQRPYSFWKIFFFILMILGILLLFAVIGQAAG